MSNMPPAQRNVKMTKEVQSLQLTHLIEKTDKKLKELKHLISEEAKLDFASYDNSNKLFKHYDSRQIELKKATRAMLCHDTTEPTRSPAPLTVSMRKAAIKKSSSAKNLSELAPREGKYDGPLNFKPRSSMRQEKEIDYCSLDRKVHHRGNIPVNIDRASITGSIYFAKAPVVVDTTSYEAHAAKPNITITASQSGRRATFHSVDKPNAPKKLESLPVQPQNANLYKTNGGYFSEESPNHSTMNRSGASVFFEETKPFEMEDFYKYSTKFRTSTPKRSQTDIHSNVPKMTGLQMIQDCYMDSSNSASDPIDSLSEEQGFETLDSLSKEFDIFDLNECEQDTLDGATTNFKETKEIEQPQENPVIPRLDSTNYHLYTPKERQQILKLYFIHTFPSKTESEPKTCEENPPMLPPKTKAYNRQTIGHISAVRTGKEETEGTVSFPKSRHTLDYHSSSVQEKEEEGTFAVPRAPARRTIGHVSKGRTDEAEGGTTMSFPKPTIV